MEWVEPLRTKFALVSHVLPPSWSGQAVVLHRLLRALDPDCYCLISRQNCDGEWHQQSPSSKLSAQYFCLSGEPWVEYLGRFGLSGMGSRLKTYRRARQISRIVRKEQVSAIVACSGDLYDLPAAYLVSQWSSARYYVYLFDDYLYQWPMTFQRAFARRWEETLMKGVSGVIVPNEFLGDEYRSRYGIRPTVIHNPCEEPEIKTEQEAAWPSDPEDIKLVYTGAIYHAHYDAFQNLIKAIQEAGVPPIRLHLYSAQPPSDLERVNIQGPVVFHPHQPASEVAKVQQQADILFLALAFHSPIPEVIRTSAPGKMGEYLASGRPILVHAPPDSFLSWYFKKEQCGLVVEQKEPGALSRAIRRLIEDGRLRKRLVENALRCARRDFSLVRARSDFMRLLQTVPGGRTCESSL